MNVVYVVNVGSGYAGQDAKKFVAVKGLDFPGACSDNVHNVHNVHSPTYMSWPRALMDDDIGSSCLYDFEHRQRQLSQLVLRGVLDKSVVDKIDRVLFAPSDQ